MSTEMDFKALWNDQITSERPGIETLLKKADQLKRNSRNKLIGLNILLLGTVVFMIWIGVNIDNLQFTTGLGLALIVIAIISYLVVYDQLMPLLFKADPLTSSRKYLEQLILIKRKMDFLNRVMINIYFSLLSIGMFLYMLQFTARGTLTGILLSYGITFGWIGFAWFYLRPRGIKKKQKPLNDIIARLEEVDSHLREG